MNTTWKRTAPLLIITLMVVVLLGCVSTSKTPDLSPTPSLTKPVPAIIGTPDPAYTNAQATKDSGQNQLLELSRKSTEVSLNMSQAANAAAQSTQEYNRRQKIDLDYQTTAISLNIAHAAATQKFITEQTKMARDVTATAQSSAATSAYLAYLIQVTQTARARAILDSQDLQTSQAGAALTAYPMTATAQAVAILNAQALQTAQANATLTAYPLTATPFAVTQAALLMQQYDREQRSFINRIVVPMIPILAILDLLLFILVLVFAYPRFLPVLWPRRLRIMSGNLNPSPIMIDGVIVEHAPRLQTRMVPPELAAANLPELPTENEVHVEIVNGSEPPVAHWIADVEHQWATEGGLSD